MKISRSCRDGMLWFEQQVIQLVQIMERWVDMAYARLSLKACDAIYNSTPQLKETRR